MILLAQAVSAGLNGWQIAGGVLLLIIGEVIRRTLNAQESKHAEHDKKHEADVAALQKARDDIGERLAALEQRDAVRALEVKHLAERIERSDT